MSLPAAVLWDMDGTLVDTEPNWIAAEHAIVAEHGGTWSDEFAHQLDQEDGQADGAPACGLSRNELRVWCHVMQEAYTKFLDKANRRQKTVIDKYGATNPAEFFAVVTETFFEKPKQLRKKWPELYELMKSFYSMDPLAWE